MNLSDFSPIVSAIISIGVLMGGLGYLISVFKKGSKEQKDDIVSSADTLTKFWQDQAEGYKVMMAEKDKSNDEKFRAMSTEIGELRGQLTSEKSQNERLEKIFQNRDPETKQFMELMIQASKDQSESHKEIVRVLGEIHTMSKAEHDRDMKIEATITKN